ncbi:MAG: GxxExxY protein [Spirochaetota bacterium]
MDYKYSELTGNIIGAAMEVHSYLGSGYQEVIYQRALSFELQLREIPHQREVTMEILYKEKKVGTRRVDFLVYDKISVEIKAISQLDPIHMTQAINYLEIHNQEVGLLINFGEPKLKFHRLENKKWTG